MESLDLTYKLVDLNIKREAPDQIYFTWLIYHLSEAKSEVFEKLWQRIYCRPLETRNCISFCHGSYITKLSYFRLVEAGWREMRRIARYSAKFWGIRFLAASRVAHLVLYLLVCGEHQ